MRKIAILAPLVSLALVGCSTIAGPKGQYLGAIDCAGKGMLSFSGGPYAGTIQADCPEDPNRPGFHFSHTRERHSEVPPTQ